MLGVTSGQLLLAAPSGSRAIIEAIASKSGPVFAKYCLTNRNRALGFLSTALEETGFNTLSENLNYSAARAAQVWSSMFPTAAVAAPYAANPQALANKVYGGRMGNVGPNDGWLYRGQGLIQITGRDNFAKLERLTGLPLIAHPEYAANPEYMLECSVALFVEYPHIREFCDAQNWQAVWALVGSGSATGRVMNLANHLAALARLEKAIPALVDVPATVQTPLAPPSPAPPTPVAAVVAPTLWERLWHWFAAA